MAQFVLEILDGDRAGEVLSLAEGTLRIGRRPGNDLVIADEKASGVHAEVVFDGGRYVLRDLGSTNGTLMDGRKVTEVVLSRGDTFAIGRTRLRFAGEGEPADLSTSEIAMAKIDAARLQAAQGGGKGRSATALVAVLLLVLAGGGYFWFAGAGQGGGEGEGTSKVRAIVAVEGNKLDGEAASCEVETGWDLRAGGVGFQAGGSGHTGRQGFEAVRAADGADFAVLATAAEIKVLAGRSLQVAAHLRTFGAARAAVRLSFWTSGDASPFRFRTGLPCAESAAWERRDFACAVPPGADRCRLEIVALLPDESSRVQCDDIALVDGGTATAVETKVGDVGTAIGTGAFLALRSMDADAPVVIAQVMPAECAPEFRGLVAADLLAPSDLGMAVAATPDDTGLKLVATGCTALELGFPAESGSGLMAEAGSGFAGVDANGAFTAQRLLLGDRATRCLLEFASPAACTGRTHGGLYRLQVPVAELRVQLAFRQERQAARDQLRAAEAKFAEGQPGQALDALRELLRTVPHDSETTALVIARRGEWLAAVQERLRAFAKDLDEAEFFDTRGGYLRVVAGLDELLQKYGEANVVDPQGLAAMRTRAQERLAQLDTQRSKDQKERLLAMAAAFESAQQTGLASLVRDYVTRQFGKQE